MPERPHTMGAPRSDASSSIILCEVEASFKRGRIPRLRERPLQINKLGQTDPPLNYRLGRAVLHQRFSGGGLQGSHPEKSTP